MQNNQPAQKLQLAFECENLANMDSFSKSDPIIFLFIKEGNFWKKLDRTEIIHDSLNPQFVTKITVQYNFEQNNLYRVEIYDVDDDKNLENTKLHDPLGYLEFTLHEVVTSLNQVFRKQIINPAKP